MPTQLTLTGNSCNRGNPAGDQSMLGQGRSEPSNRRSSDGQGKACMVTAILRESQTRGLRSAATHWRFRCRLAQRRRAIAHGPILSWPRHPILVEEYGRTGHLTTSPLTDRETTGSPKRVVSDNPAWRRSCHISQTPGVMPGTAAATRTVLAETSGATWMGTPSDRVKGSASTGASNFMTGVR